MALATAAARWCVAMHRLVRGSGARRCACRAWLRRSRIQLGARARVRADRWRGHVCRTLRRGWTGLPGPSRRLVNVLQRSGGSSPAVDGSLFTPSQVARAQRRRARLPAQVAASRLRAGSLARWRVDRRRSRHALRCMVRSTLVHGADVAPRFRAGALRSAMYRKHAPTLPTARAGDSGQHPTGRDEPATARDADTASDDVLDVPAVARLLTVGRNTVYALVARNAIPHRRIGRLIRFHRDALMRWLNSCCLQDAKERQ